jgi:hypothetical protein
MNNPFRQGSDWYPVRWFLVLIAVLTMSMSYFDYTGNRFLGYTGNQFRPGSPHSGFGYYGSHYYHK